MLLSLSVYNQGHQFFITFYFYFFQKLNLIKKMDRINGLPDELLMKVLKELPTKDAVSTSLLSKRWERLWMHLLNLQFKNTLDVGYRTSSFQSFLDRNLPFHEVPLESLLLDIDNFRAESISQWIVFAIQKSIKDLDNSIDKIQV